MTKNFKQIADEVGAGVGLLREHAPDAMKGFAALAVGATTTHSIDTKMKELMALAIGIATHCDGCVAYHAKIAPPRSDIRRGRRNGSPGRLHGRRPSGRLRCGRSTGVRFLCGRGFAGRVRKISGRREVSSASISQTLRPTVQRSHFSGLTPTFVDRARRQIAEVAGDSRILAADFLPF